MPLSCFCEKLVSGKKRSAQLKGQGKKKGEKTSAKNPAKAFTMEFKHIQMLKF